MSEIPGSIVLYHPAMAASVARMFNDFSSLWPGGFGGGSSFDEQRVRDWLDTTSAIADLIALDTDGEPVGYCGLYPHWRDRDAAYVTTLGVVPRVKGGKFGRRLLLRAVEIARERGLRRVDLNTWAGNLDAVPLYKKTGLFWVPETSIAVYMQNYVPALAQIPLAGEWFDRYPDWYHCFQRELEQAPDRQIVDGMELYTYHFQAGQDQLTAEVDRYGWGICGIERVLDGQQIAIKTRLRAHNILIGIPNAMTLTIENGSDQDLALALSVKPFKGLEWVEQDLPPSLTVRSGAQVSLTREFVVDRTAKTCRHEASEVIRSRVSVRGQVVDLVTGGKIQPAVEILSQQGYQTVPPGGEAQICLDLRNNASQPLAGKVDVWVEGVEGSEQSLPFALGPQELSGLIVPVHVPAALRSPELAVHAVAYVQAGDISPAMPEFRFPLVADLPELATIVVENDRRRLHLLTDVVDVTVELEGGDINMGRRSLPDARKSVGFEVGPPFGLNSDATLQYEYNVFHDDRALVLLLTGDSAKVPGLRIEKYLRVTPGRREVEHWVTLANVRDTEQGDGVGQSPYAAGGRLYIFGPFTLAPNPFGEAARSFTPVDGQMVECDAQLPFVNESAVPQTPDHWSETWTAAQNLARGDLVAWFWEPDGIAKVKVNGGMLSSLESEARPLQPGEPRDMFHVWYGFSFASLVDVRHRWNQLVGHRELPWGERVRGLPTVHPIEACWVGENTVLVGHQVRKQVDLRFAVSCTLTGQLSLRLPDGWSGAFPTPDGSRETLPIPQGAPGVPSLVDVDLSVPARSIPGGSRAASGETATVGLHLSAEYEMDLELPLLLAREGEVEVYQQELEGHPVYTVANGVLQFHVLTEVGGNLIRLQDAHGRTFLEDNYPDIMPNFFLPEHIGGVQPAAYSADAETPFVALERVQAQAVAEGLWQGVQVLWTAQNQEKLRGQVFSATYLVLSGSGIVRCRVAHHNPSPRRIVWGSALFINIALGGSRDGTLLTAPGGTQTWVRNRASQGFGSRPNLNYPWARASKGDQSLTLIALRESVSAVRLFDFGQLIGGFADGTQQTQPYGTATLEFALAVNQPVEKAMEIVQALRRASSSRLGYGPGKA